MKIFRTTTRRALAAVAALLAAGCDHPTAERTRLAPAPSTSQIPTSATQPLLGRTVERLADQYAEAGAPLPSRALPVAGTPPTELRWLTPTTAEAAARAHSAELAALVAQALAATAAGQEGAP